MRSADRPRVSQLFVRAFAAFLIMAFTPISIDSAFWWRSPRVASALDLSSAQAREIEYIYQSTLTLRMTREAEAAAAHAIVKGLLTSEVSDENVEAAVAEAAAADQAANVARNVMLYRMFRVLSAQQRQRLSDAHDAQRLSVVERTP